MFIKLSKPTLSVTKSLLHLPKFWSSSSTKILFPTTSLTSEKNTLQFNNYIYFIINFIKNGLDKQKFTVGRFLDIRAVFDCVWQIIRQSQKIICIICKLKRTLPNRYYLLLKSFLEHHNYTVRHADDHPALWYIKDGVLQVQYYHNYYKKYSPMTCQHASFANFFTYFNLRFK